MSTRDEKKRLVESRLRGNGSTIEFKPRDVPTDAEVEAMKKDLEIQRAMLASGTCDFNAIIRSK